MAALVLVRPLMPDMIVVSMHEKGFPCADLYRCVDGWDENDWDGAVPDAFFTMKRGDTLEQAAARAKMKWPGADVQICHEADDSDADA